MNILISLHLLLMMLLLGETSEARDPAGLDQLTRCIKIAEPLVKDSDNIFPLTIRDIERVCKLWDELTYCVKDYTLTYLTHTQQLEFNLAIESSIKSANQLCADDPEYRTSYVINAPCLKRVSINTSLCGGQYNYLADLVQGFQATDAQMCWPNARDCPRGNFGMPTSPTNPDNSYNNQNHNANNHNNNDYNYNHHTNDNNGGRPPFAVRPDDTFSTATTTTTWTTSPPPAPTTPTTRFTWTTPTLPTPRPTANPSLSLAGNSLFAAETQKYRGSGTSIVPPLATLMLGIAAVFRL
ncbi:uncharacterized protein [Cherax quadricarinatus]|uniref:uncharacterized protein isoform X2 n=1 Tax=Cherax quadricarinatus TaxID=27406 RepID=UPI00387E5B03